MIVPELAQALFKAYHNNEIYSISNFLIDIDEDKEELICSTKCEICSLPKICRELFILNNTADRFAFLNNTKPVYDYIKYNYPEYLL